MTCRTGIKMREGKYIRQDNIKWKDLMFTLRERFIFVISKLSWIRVSSSGLPLAKTEKSWKDIGCPVSLLCAKMLDKEVEREVSLPEWAEMLMCSQILVCKFRVVSLKYNAEQRWHKWHRVGTNQQRCYWLTTWLTFCQYIFISPWENMARKLPYWI